jgi:hypothetical protein
MTPEQSHALVGRWAGRKAEDLPAETAASRRISQAFRHLRFDARKRHSHACPAVHRTSEEGGLGGFVAEEPLLAVHAAAVAGE